MIYSDFRPLLNRVKFVQDEQAQGPTIQFYDCRFSFSALPEGQKKAWAGLQEVFQDLESEVNEYLDSFSAAMQSDKASAPNEPKYLKDLNTMKTLSE